MAAKKITRRWLLNNFGVIVFIVLVIEVVFGVSITSYHYSAVRQTLITRANLANTTFQQYYDDPAVTDFTGQVREYVSDFSAKDQMELMTIDADGRVALTSSGFQPTDADYLPDYHKALEAEDNIGEQIYRLNSQRVMAITVLSPVDTSQQSSLSAVRFVVSLGKVERQIAIFIVGMLVLGILILLLVLFTSYYFISSIVNPVGEVGETARRIAQGDFAARLQRRSDDEIGELCDIINYMAGELANTEQLKNDFISSVSHELRTPLTAIRGWGETLLFDGGQDKEMLQKGMGVIINETGRLSQMVEELLDFSRMQSGRLKLVQGRMDPLAELSEAVLMYTERAKREGIQLVYQEPDFTAPVYGDKNKLRQVFVNVIDNAIKYSDSGDTVTVDASLDGHTLTIRFADTGIGIKEEDLPEVKKKFYKANSTRRGSGIGLAVAEEIVTRHGGALELTSRYGEGTTVTLTLPICKTQDETVAVSEDPATPHQSIE